VPRTAVLASVRLVKLSDRDTKKVCCYKNKDSREESEAGWIDEERRKLAEGTALPGAAGCNVHRSAALPSDDARGVKNPGVMN